MLTANGYTTVGLSAHDGVNRDNVGRGFERFDIVGERATLARDANDVNAAALAWLQASPRKPWFMYLHYLDVHHYREHPGLTAAHSDETGRDDQTLRAKVGAGVLSDSEAARRDAWDFTPQEVARLHQLYDGEARYVDERLRALFAELERRGALANTIVVITADHGEQFGRHLTFGHGTNLYETLVRVPLIIALPGESGRQIDAPTQNAGLAPTLLRELNIAAPAAHFSFPPFACAATSRRPGKGLMSTPSSLPTTVSSSGCTTARS